MKVDRALRLFAVVFGLVSSACAASPRTSDARLLGQPVTAGKGTLTSYTQLGESGAPKAIGVVFTRAAVEEPPPEISDGHRCFDANQDGSIDLQTECSAWHEYVLPLPSEISRRTDIPFKWALVNWNPQGHIPQGVWDRAHFDVHFYLEPIERVFAIQRGPCGPEFVRCDQFLRARKPVPPNYVPGDYKDVQAVAPAMGNHLIDPSGPELHGEPFKRHWIYGIYDGRVIFYEEMVGRDYLMTRPQVCNAIKSPEAVALSGYYPTRSCIRYEKATDEYTVSMEDFVMRTASPAQPISTTEIPGGQ
jgi:hypothetical protein